MVVNPIPSRVQESVPGECSTVSGAEIGVEYEAAILR
jgi:hypothetical protein